MYVKKQLSDIRVVIMAAGTYNSWDRHCVKIFNETTIERTFRQFSERGITDIWVTTSEPNKYNIGKEFINKFDGNTLNCLGGAKKLKGDIYVFGDVFFTDDAINKIITGRTNYYMRLTGNEIKPYGEFFAFKVDKKFWKIFDEFINWCKKNKIKKVWSWKLFNYHQNIINNSDNVFENWTEISDQTDDFDKPEELEKWINFYYEKNTS
jgi:hypothetical protein